MLLYIKHTNTHLNPYSYTSTHKTKTQAKVPVHQFSERIPTAGYRGRGFSSGQGERKWLLRLATLTERLQIRDKVSSKYSKVCYNKLEHIIFLFIFLL